MQDHNIPLSLFIISVYILTVLVLWNIVSNGHIMVTSCLFLRYDPSTRPQKSLKCGKSTNASSWIRDFFAFFNFQNGVLREGIWGGLRKIRFISILHVISFCNYFKTTLRPNWLSRTLIFVHCQVQSLCWPLCGEVISIPNLRTTCLRCILSPTSFQFFENFQKQW